MGNGYQKVSDEGNRRTDCPNTLHTIHPLLVPAETAFTYSGELKPHPLNETSPYSLLSGLDSLGRYDALERQSHVSARPLSLFTSRTGSQRPVPTLRNRIMVPGLQTHGI